MKPDGPLFDREWRHACRVEPVSREEATNQIRRHYLGRWPGVNVLLLGMKRDARLLGIITFALPPRETSTRYGGTTWELARLFVEDDVPKNAETFLISKAVIHIKRHRPDVAVLVSYADPSTGKKYSRRNHIPHGVTVERVPRISKHRFIYRLDK